jgi:hypothetical protein
MHAPNSNEGYLNKILQFGNLIKVLVTQPSDHITICVDPQNCRPINGSIDNLKTSKYMHPIQMKDALRKFFNLEVQLRFQ